MKFLVVGLGNPGAEYEMTRHNIGFRVLDLLASANEASWNNERHGSIARIQHKGRQLILLKPNTYMNLSGKAVSYWMQQEKVKLENVLVITDDLALPTAKLRLKTKGSDGGHNGLKSINETLGTMNYPRLRFGVGNAFPAGRQVNYVLGEFEPEEKEIVNTSIEKAAEAVKLYTVWGPGQTMTQVNAG
jgi:peptidyl-tRNA hydrolase, PTH1 family